MKRKNASMEKPIEHDESFDAEPVETDDSLPSKYVPGGDRERSDRFERFGRYEHSHHFDFEGFAQNVRRYINNNPRLIRMVLRHVSVTLSLLALTVLVIDIYNPSMEFVNTVFIKRVLMVLCICVVVKSSVYG